MGRFALLMLSIVWLQACQAKLKIIEVQSIERQLIDNKFDQEACGAFVLEKKDVIIYFNKAKEVDAHAFHYESIISSCAYEGDIEINGVEYKWIIYAGGAAYLFNKKIEKKYLCKERCCDALLSDC